MLRYRHISLSAALLGLTGCSSEGTSSSTGGTGGTGMTASAGSSAAMGGSSGMGAMSAGGGMGGSAGTGAIASALDCTSVDLSQATRLAGDLTAEATWRGLIYLAEDVDVYGSTLTIEPGTLVVMGADVSVSFGWNGNATTLLAEGTPEAPIRFCGRTATPGYWGGPHLQDAVTSASRLSHVIVSDGGGQAERQAAVVLEAPVHIDGLTIRGSGETGLYARDFAAQSQGVSVLASEGAAVVLEAPEALTHFPLGGTIADNGEDVVRLAFDTIWEQEVVAHALPVPYLQERSVDVYTGSLTMEAGVEYRFTADTDLEIGWNGGTATLTIDGTQEAPVLLRGEAQEPGAWAGLILGTAVRTASVLRHVTISDAGGSDTPALHVQSAVLLDHVSVSGVERGVRIERQGLRTGSTHLSVTGAAQAPLVVLPDALVSLPEGGSFTGNTADYVAVEGGDYTRTGVVPNLGVPYRVLASIDTWDGSALTLTAGTQFTMASDVALTVGWNGGSAAITAEGTEGAPIRFVGLDPSAGYWRGIEFGGNVLSSSRLRYVEIGHAGGAPMGACLRLGRALDIASSTIHDCVGYGILRDSTDVTDYTVLNTISAAELAVVGTN